MSVFLHFQYYFSYQCHSVLLVDESKVRVEYNRNAEVVLIISNGEIETLVVNHTGCMCRYNYHTIMAFMFSYMYTEAWEWTRKCVVGRGGGQKGGHESWGKLLKFTGKYEDKLLRWTEKWGGGKLLRRAAKWGEGQGDRKLGQAFLTDKQKKGNSASKHTFIATNLLIYCTFSASMLKVQLFLHCLPKKVRTHAPLLPRLLHS